MSAPNTKTHSSTDWVSYATIDADKTFGQPSRRIRCRTAGTLMLLGINGDAKPALIFTIDGESHDVQASGIVDSGSTAAGVDVFF